MLTGFSPETLVVDEAGGHVYYTDSQVGAIYRMNLDGSDHDSIINGVGRCTGLVIDTANEWVLQTPRKWKRFTWWLQQPVFVLALHGSLLAIIVEHVVCISEWALLCQTLLKCL